MPDIAESTPPTTARKRLMFLTQEDFYFLTYNSLILLSGLGSTTKNKSLKDMRKLAFLIDFVSSPYLTALMSKSTQDDTNLPEQDKAALASAYARAKDRLPFVNRLVYALEKRSLVSTQQDLETKTVNVFLQSTDLSETFINSELFEFERKNIQELLVTIPRVRTLSLSTLLERLFRNHGVVTWLD